MTHVIRARNVNDALSSALKYMREHGLEEQSRNGPVLVAPGPVVTEYARPWERVLFNPKRDANPVFHAMEGLWMLAGANDVEWPTRFNKNFYNFSDDGEIVHGAYGHRWREWFGFDQLNALINHIQGCPDTRRAVLTMWSPNGDLVDVDGVGGLGGKDVPCNTQAYFDVRGGALNMTVTCRSNDMIWGAYGANAVHFSMLQEYLAIRLKVPMGLYRQFSNNFHMYLELYPNIVTKSTMAELTHMPATDPYWHGMTHYPLMQTDDASWMEDLRTFMRDPLGDEMYADPFFEHVATPMYHAWHAWKTKDMTGAWNAAELIQADDWRHATVAWLSRRVKK